MAQSTSPLPSRSPQGSSPSESMHRRDDSKVSIETLVSHLVAAKRSLASIHLVHRATTILSDARTIIELTAITIARTKYLRRALSSQLEILRGIQFEIEGVAQAIKIEIKAVSTELQQTDQKLAENIRILRATKIEEGFKNVEQIEVAAQGMVVDKDNLHDFVDGKPLEELRNNIETAIAGVDEAEAKIDESIHLLEDDLENINGVLHEKTASSSSTRSDLQPPNISKTLKVLEEHAHEMAMSLESLVRHFDLCVTAIKHTEGAGAAVAKAVNAEDLPEGGVDAFEAPEQPMTDEERVEMLQVLENDAAEVEEVVMELQDRSAEMEGKLEQLMLWRERSENTYSDIGSAFRLLEKVGARLSTHVAENARFTSRWAEEKERLEDGMAGMEELCEVYERFLDAYDGMVVEAARRRTVKKRMEKIANEAQTQLEQLYEEDLNERDIFRTEQGDFLPSDIWAGLSSLPPRFVFSRLDVGGESVPELPRKTVEEALRRLKAGGRKLAEQQR